MNTSRREFIRKSSLLAASSSFELTHIGKENQPYADGNRLVLLGTQGGPFIRSYKQTPSSNLIVHNAIPYIIDTGYGVTFKLRDAGINLSTLKYIFITHHHSDHNLELGPLLYNAWVAGLSQIVHVYAPIGVKNLLDHFWQSNDFDITTRIRDEGRPDIRTLVVAHEIEEGSIMSDSGVEISALKNIHPPIENSYAFRFKLGEKLIVFSGDTAYCAPLIAFAERADYLIHEVMYPPAVEEMVKRRPNATKLKASILSHHTAAEDVGKIARDAHVKNLILNHFVPPDEKTMTDEVWINATRSTFSGNIIVGKDLLEFPF